MSQAFCRGPFSWPVDWGEHVAPLRLKAARNTAADPVDKGYEPKVALGGRSHGRWRRRRARSADPGILELEADGDLRPGDQRGEEDEGAPRGVDVNHVLEPEGAR